MEEPPSSADLLHVGKILFPVLTYFPADLQVFASSNTLAEEVAEMTCVCSTINSSHALSPEVVVSTSEVEHMVKTLALEVELKVEVSGRDCHR